MRLSLIHISGEGDLDYRIREIVPGRPNELERLMNGFNRMMEEINTLSVSLYTVSYTHLDVYKRQAQSFRQALPKLSGV